MIVGNPKSVGESPAEAVTPQVFLKVIGGGPLVWRSDDPVGTQVVNVVVEVGKRGCACPCRYVYAVKKSGGKVGLAGGGPREEADSCVSGERGDQLDVVASEGSGEGVDRPVDAEELHPRNGMWGDEVSRNRSAVTGFV